MSSRLKGNRAAELEQAIRLKRAAAQSSGPGLSARPADHQPTLSEMQKSLWLTHQMDPGSAAYNLINAFRVSGALDLRSLEHSLNEIVSHHRILRSTFQASGEDVLQVVHPHSDLEVKRLTVDSGEVFAAAVHEARRPFDLEVGPLLRMVLIEDEAGRDALLLLVIHHILADERSLGLLWTQLAEAHAGQRPTPPIDFQFDDYVYWAANRIRATRAEELEYWRPRLTPLPDDLRLPFESVPADPSGPRGRLLEKCLDGALCDRVRRLAAATGSTPFMVFAFAFRLLLERYSQGQRVAFATPAMTRSHPAAVDMIGYFLNPVVVCLAIDEQQAVGVAIRDFATDMKDLLSHASVPFHVLAEDLSPPRRPDRHPIFEVMFVHQQSIDSVVLGDAELIPVELDLGESKFDLTLFVSEDDDAIDVAVEYRADRYDEIWMRRLLGHYETLLSGLVADRERQTGQVEMLTKAERTDIAAWQGQTARLDDVDLLPRQILDRSLQSTEKAAIACGGTVWRYGELEKRTAGIVRELLSQGVRPGDRVGLFLDRSPLMIAGLLACHRTGAAYVPLDPAYPPTRNREVMEDADVAAVLTTTILSRSLPDGKWPTLCVEGESCAPLEAIELPVIDPEAIAYILYTSGSTGRPKGVVVSQDNLRASTQARRLVYEFTPKRYLLLPSVAFDSSVAGIFWTLSSGGTLVLPTDEEIRDPRRLAQLVTAENVDSLLCVPSLYAAILRASPDGFSRLEVAIVAGESCSSALVQEHFSTLPHVRLFNEYGPTEATVWATVHEITPEDENRPVAIGRPIPGVQIRVLDRPGRAVPAGIPGQAWIGGPTVAQGYWRRQDETEERFLAPMGRSGDSDRWYRTGDLVTWTEGGDLLFAGRQDEQIKLRGFRIEPGEIESVLLEIPGIEEAAVVARPLGAAADGPVNLVAFVSPLQSPSLDDWREILTQRLPEFMLPRRLVELAELPRLPNGKADRGRLRSSDLEPAPPSASADSATSEREQALMLLWQGLLRRVGFGVLENFFELGGHSLLVVEMTYAIERDHGVRLAASEIFQNPTVRQLAQTIERQSGTERTLYAHLFPIQPAGRKSPFVVAIPHVFTEMLATRFRGERPVYGLRGVGLRPEGNRGRWRTMEDLGEELVDEIQRRFPDESCYLAGYSFGATMAFEAVRLMETRGISVRGLFLIAPMPLNFYPFGPLRLQIEGLREPVKDLGVGQAWRLLARENSPLSRRPYRRVRRLLMVQPWRRILGWIGRGRRLFGLPLTPAILHADVRIERFRLHRGYMPGTLRTPTTIFNPREAEADIAATWRPHFQGPLTVVETPDPHLGEDAIAAAREGILARLVDLED